MDPRGAALALFAYLAWGMVAVYWKALGPLPAPLVLSHRVLFSTIALGVVVTATREWGAVSSALRAPRTRAALLLSASLITVNWGLFLWAVIQGHMVEASLGYFINPLVNVLLGTVFLGERLRRAQWIAVALASLGVAYLAWAVGRPPWLALTLASTFGLYGMVRKRASVGAAPGLLLETALSLPVAVAYVGWSERGGDGLFATRPPAFLLLLAMSGVVTAVPLLAFNGAARRLPLSVLGFFQYLSPTCQLLLAVFAYGEALGRDRAIAFGLIWAAIAVFVAQALLSRQPAASGESSSSSSSSSSSRPESSASSSSSGSG